MLRRWKLVVLLISLGSVAHAETQPTPDATRGELLYQTHCIACHGDEVHWRDKKLVTDRKSLQSEIRRWMEVSGLRWSNEDIAEVGRYLNAAYYRSNALDY
jgi:mono/diheme cytochrome c family protein